MVEDKALSSESENTGTQQVENTEQTPFIDLPTKYDRLEPLLEFLATILLAVTTLAVAWSGYQSARWGGVQSTKFSQAGALRTESVRASNTAGQFFQIDIGLFTNWINAYANDNQPLVEFYEERFRDEFKPAFEAWLATDPQNNPDAPSSPFTMPEYSVSFAEEAERLEAEAAKTFEEGSEANQTSDDYILNTVLLASVLFLSGIYSRFKAIRGRIILLVFALLLLMIGLINIATYPIQ